MVLAHNDANTKIAAITFADPMPNSDYEIQLTYYGDVASVSPCVLYTQSKSINGFVIVSYHQNGISSDQDINVSWSTSGSVD